MNSSSRSARQAAALMLLPIGALLLSMSGCATVLNGRSETVLITSEPSGAALTVDGIDQGTTPAVIALTRKRAHTLGVELAGHAPDTSTLVPKARYGLVALNLVLFHPAVAAAGVAVDSWSGAHSRFPNRVVNYGLRPTVDTVPVNSTRAPWGPAPIGSRLRVSAATVAGAAPAPPLTGTLTAVALDTLLLQALDPALTHRIARRSIDSLELSLGADHMAGISGGAWRGAVVGFIAGAIVGAIQFGYEGAYYYSLLYGVPAGLVAGSAAGALFPPEGWLRIH